MQTFDIVKDYKAKDSFRVASVLGKFGLESNLVKERFTGSLDIDSNDWNIGVIYGASGTGKSTIAKQLFKESYVYSFEYGDKSVIDEMPTNVDFDTITATFNNVGFSTVWSWIKPYSVLSDGEKMRVNIARALLEDRSTIAFDEFTSVVNRDVAKVSSFAISKAVKRTHKKFIAISCHDDILEWIEPDWVFCTNDMSFQKKTQRDRKLTLKSFNAKETCGKLLGVITT